MNKLGKAWKVIKEKYKLLEILGEGSGGQVVRASHRESKTKVAIKLIECDTSDLNHMKYVCRELAIMR